MNSCYIIRGFLLFIFLLSMGCQSNPKQTQNKSAANYAEIRETIIKFNFNQSFEIKEVKQSTRVSDLYIRGIGFQKSNHTIRLENVAPLETALIADLDQNGFEELYLITRSVGSGSYANIYGILSVDGNRYKAIYNPEIDSNQRNDFKYFENYKGHDSIYLENQMLKRSFPLYLPDDPNCCPTGGKRVLSYKLINFENSYSIQVSNEQ